MPFITKDGLNKRLTDLERRVCCHKTLFYDNLAAFPVEGKVETLYVDESTGAVYIWTGTEYITADFQPIHTNVAEAVPYTGTELPTEDGVVIGDTVSAEFNNNIIADYTWNGTVWVLNFTTRSIGTPPRLSLNIGVPFNGGFTTGQTKDVVLRLRERNGVDATGGVLIDIPAIPGFTMAFDNTATTSTNPSETISNSLFSATVRSDGSLKLYSTLASGYLDANANIYLRVDLTATGGTSSTTFSPNIQYGSGGSVDTYSLFATIGLSIT